MPNIIVIYDSKTGNTEKMAQAVAKGAEGVEDIIVNLKKVDDAKVEDLLEADGIVIGSPTYYGLLSNKIKSFLDESVKIHGKLEGKVGAAFTSSGGIASGAETTLISIIQALLVHGMIIQGRAKRQHYGEAVVGTPNEENLKACEEFGARVARLVLRCK